MLKNTSVKTLLKKDDEKTLPNEQPFPLFKIKVN